MILAESLPNTYEGTFKNKQFNTSALTVWAQDDCFHLQPNYSKSLIPTVLKINRRTSEITEVKTQDFQQPKAPVSSFFVSFFIGIINLNGKQILMLSEQVQLVCTLNRRDIFKITKPIFLFFDPADKKKLTDQQARLLVNLVIIFESGMYFSYAYNLTEPLHHIKKLQNTQISGSFNWAQSFQNQLIHCNSMWSIPVIQGFVNKIQLYMNAQKMKIILISRRSLKQGGPWQYTTGLSESGNAANFVQTQQIFSVNDFLFSFVQVRGSVPLFWTQKFSYGIPSDVSFRKDSQQNFQALRLHVSNMLRNHDYKNVILLNLLSKQSGSEKKLIQNYEYLVRKTQKQKAISLQKSSSSKSSVSLHYYFYDIHHNCPNKNYQGFNKFVTEQLSLALQACEVTVIRVTDQKNYQILNTQKGVIRSNCGTCIDRTNIAQSRIAACQLVYILKHININVNSFDQGINFVDGNQAFATLYRNLWADNGDSISQQYTGTGSTQSYAIRKGKLSYLTTIDHGLTSLVRAVRNIRQEDQEKNKTILFLLKNFKSRLQKQEEKSKQNVKEGDVKVQKQKLKQKTEGINLLQETTPPQNQQKQDSPSLI